MCVAVSGRVSVAFLVCVFCGLSVHFMYSCSQFFRKESSLSYIFSFREDLSER